MFRRAIDRVKYKSRRKQPNSATATASSATGDVSETGLCEEERGKNKQLSTIATVAPASVEHPVDRPLSTTIALSRSNGDLVASSPANGSVTLSPATDSATPTPLPHDTKSNTTLANSPPSPSPSPSHSPPPPPSEQSLWDRAYDALKNSNPKLVADYEKLLDAEAKSTSVCKSLLLPRILALVTFPY